MCIGTWQTSSMRETLPKRYGIELNHQLQLSAAYSRKPTPSLTTNNDYLWSCLTCAELFVEMRSGATPEMMSVVVCCPHMARQENRQRTAKCSFSLHSSPGFYQRPSEDTSDPALSTLICALGSTIRRTCSQGSTHFGGRAGPSNLQYLEVAEHSSLHPWLPGTLENIGFVAI